MNNRPGNNTNENKSYRVFLLLIVGLAAFSSAMNELNQYQSLALRAGKLVAAWSDVIVPTVNASAPVVSSACIAEVASQNVRHSDEFRWNGAIPAGQSIEIKNINGEIAADAAAGQEVQVVAIKKSRISDVDSVQIKVVPHAGGVTICAVYPNADGEYRSNCGVGDDEYGGSRGSSSNGSLRNNDVRVDFTVHVPASVGFVGKSVNGGITATSLSGNVVTKTVNGSIKISTSGYAEAATVNGEISARFNDASWPNSLSFKTINGEINLDLPANLNASVDAQTMNGSINSDFPLNVLEMKGKKSIKATIGSGGRELQLKTLNGSINLRKAG